MSVATVVTRGYGSFGSVAAVVLAGYSSAELPAPGAPVVGQGNVLGSRVFGSSVIGRSQPKKEMRA